MPAPAALWSRHALEEVVHHSLRRGPWSKRVEDSRHSSIVLDPAAVNSDRLCHVGPAEMPAEANGSLRPDTRLLCHFGPLRDLAAYLGGEFIGRIADRLESKARELLPHIG
jgi:hypothetical protein